MEARLNLKGFMDKKKAWQLELGATVSREGVRFRVWAPKISSLSLKIVGGLDGILMDREGRGYRTVFVNDLKAGTKYFYHLNGKGPRPDPVSRYQPEGVHGPSEVVDPCDFKWQDQDWKGIPMERMIFYEIHVGAFSPEETFDAIIPFLRYLKDDLGVTAIELMPVAQFPGTRNWGYDGTYPYAPQNSYGGASGLKRLVDQCHQIGLAVLLDVVYNHLGPEGNYLGDYGPYFTDRYKTPWGAAINFDGPESDEVRRFFVDNALYWVTEYHMDGLRVDAVHGIYDFSAHHILSEVRKAVHDQGKRLGRHVVILAESDLNDVRVIDPPRRGGHGLNGQWNDDFHHSLHALLTGEQTGYYQDFGQIDQLVKALREGFVYSGQYSAFRKRRHGSSSKHLPPFKFVVSSQNHDQIGNRMRGDRLTTLIPFEALKLAAAIVLLSPNIPLLFMGEEYGEEAPFQYFVSHTDPELIGAVRKGRGDEFASFQWKGDLPDPQEEASFIRSKVRIPMHREGRHQTLFSFYRKLIHVRREVLPTPFRDRRGINVKLVKGKKAISMEWFWENERVVSFFNFDNQAITVEPIMEEGPWQKAIDSSSKEWGGSGETSPEVVESRGRMSLMLPPYGFLLFKRIQRTL